MHCRCDFPISQVPPSFYTKNFRDAFMQCLGPFEGVHSKVLNSNAKVDTASQSSQINLGARASQKGTQDFELMDRIRTWAVRGHINERKLDSRESVIFGRCGEPSSHAPWYGCEEAFGSSMQMMDESNGTAGDVSGPLAELLAIFSETPHQSEPRPIQQQKKKRPRNQQSPQNHFPPTVDLIAAVWDSVQRDQAVAANLPIINGNIEQVVRQEVRPNTLGSGNNYQRPSTAVVITQDVQRDGNDAHLLPSEIIVHSSSDDSTIAQRSSKSTGAVDTISDAEDVAAIVKRMKAEERKIRNRASAHRSNMRNKAVKEALENELTVARDRIIQLRNRETMLRRENLKLRRAFIES